MAGATRFQELIVWQLADRVRIETYTLTKRASFARDLRLRSQVDDAAGSACRNIAEGFGCETHREFARFLRIARRSLNELQDGFRDAELKGHIVASDLATVQQLLRRLHPALASFIAYLDRTPNQRLHHTSSARPWHS